MKIQRARIENVSIISETGDIYYYELQLWINNNEHLLRVGDLIGDGDTGSSLYYVEEFYEVTSGVSPYEEDSLFKNGFKVKVSYRTPTLGDGAPEESVNWEAIVQTPYEGSYYPDVFWECQTYDIKSDIPAYHYRAKLVPTSGEGISAGSLENPINSSFDNLIFVDNYGGIFEIVEIISSSTYEVRLREMTSGQMGPRGEYIPLEGRLGYVTGRYSLNSDGELPLGFANSRRLNSLAIDNINAINTASIWKGRGLKLHINDPNEYADGLEEYDSDTMVYSPKNVVEIVFDDIFELGPAPVSTYGNSQYKGWEGGKYLRLSINAPQMSDLATKHQSTIWEDPETITGYDELLHYNGETIYGGTKYGTEYTDVSTTAASPNLDLVGIGTARVAGDYAIIDAGTNTEDYGVYMVVSATADQVVLDRNLGYTNTDVGVYFVSGVTASINNYNNDAVFYNKLGIGIVPSTHALEIHTTTDNFIQFTKEGIDLTDGYLNIYNKSASFMAPAIKGKTNNTAFSSLTLEGDIILGNDTGTYPVFQIDAKYNDGALVTRPILNISNNSTDLISISATGQLQLDKQSSYGITTGLWFGAGESGIYQAAVNTISLNANTVNVLVANEYQLYGPLTGGWALRQVTSSSTSPTLIPHRDQLGSGIGGIGAGFISLIANSVEGIRVNSTAAHSVAGITDYETLVTSDDDIPNKKYVDDEIVSAISSSVNYKGGYDASTDTPILDGDGGSIITSTIGDMYTVTVDGTFFTQAVNAGDLLIAETNGVLGESDWTIVNKNIPPYEFIYLTDTPSSYATYAFDFVRVNSTATGLTFVDASAINILDFTNNLASLSQASNAGIATFSYNGSSAATVGLDIATLGTTVISPTDWVPFSIASAGRKISFSNFEGTLDHGNIANTHNLTTDIDHDQLTNTHNLTTDITHNNIFGLQGGTTDQYYHLTYAEYGDLHSIYIHPNHSGHVTSIGDGATVLTVSAITGQTELSVGLLSTDELLVNDGGTIKRMDISVLETYLNIPSEYTDADVRAVVLTGLSPSGPTNVTATDTILEAFSYLEYRVDINDDKTSFPGFTSLFADYGYTEPTHSFTNLTDTPSGYVIGDIGKSVRVNATYDGLEFYTPTDANYYLDNVVVNSISDVDFMMTGVADITGIDFSHNHSGVYEPVITPANLTSTGPINTTDTGGELLVASVISIDQANTTTDGYLSSTDWNTFNNKVSFDWDYDYDDLINKPTIPNISFGTVQYQIPFTNVTTDDFDYLSTFVYTTTGLGIGIATPYGKLDVGGLITTPIAGTPIIYFSDNADVISGIEMTNTHAGTTSEWRMTIREGTSHYFVIGQGGSGNTQTLFGLARNTIDYIYNNVGSRDLLIGSLTENSIIFGTDSILRGKIDGTTGAFHIDTVSEYTAAAGITITDEVYLTGIGGSGTGTSMIYYNRSTGELTYADAPTGGGGDVSWGVDATGSLIISNAGSTINSESDLVWDGSELTITGNLDVNGIIYSQPSTTSLASINIASGSNPSGPGSGDIWWNGTQLYFYTGAANVDLLAVNSGFGSEDTIPTVNTGSTNLEYNDGFRWKSSNGVLQIQGTPSFPNIYISTIGGAFTNSQTGNIGIGYGISITGADNILISGNGVASLGSNNNVYIGSGVGNTVAGRSENIIIGKDAGQSIAGSGSIVLGYAVGKTNSVGSYEFWLHNSDVAKTAVLMYGEFDNNYLRINNTLHLGPLSSAASSPTPAEGMIYANSTDHKLYFHNGTDWVDLTDSGGMTYPGAGIAVSTGSAWGTSITDNSTNWNTAYTHSTTTTGNPHSIGYADISDFSTGVGLYNAATATKLATIWTTFSGTYPMTVNVSGTVYSHTGITFTGSTNSLTVTGDVAAGTFHVGGTSGILLQDSSDRAGLLEINQTGTATYAGIQVKFSASAFWSLMGSQTLFGLYDDYNSKWAWDYAENAGVSLYWGGATAAGVKLSTTQTGVNITGLMESDTIYSSGNVGIGTTSPAGTLDLGDGTSGRSIIWGGTTGTAHYSSIGNTWGSADLALLSGLKLSTTSDILKYSFTGTYGAMGIRMDRSAGDILFFTEVPAAHTINTTFTPANTMIIKSNGNVGIGCTPDSGSNLHLEDSGGVVLSMDNGGTTTTHYINAHGDQTTANAQIFGIHAFWGDGVGTTSSSVAAITFVTGADTINQDDGQIYFATAPSSTGLVTAMEIHNDGEIMFNLYGSNTFSGTAAYNLEVDSSGNVVETTAGSDIRFKNNIVHINNALDRITKLDTIFYNYNELGQRITGKDELRRVGFTAQNMFSVLPEAVRTIGNTEYMKVEYDEVVPLLAAGIKEHWRVTETHEDKIIRLEKRVQELEQEIESLK